MAKPIVLLALLVSLVSLSCSFPIFAGGVSQAAGPEPQPLVTLDPNAPPTATPFMPVGPTQTDAVSPTPQGTPTSDLPEDMPTLTGPTRANLPLPEGQVELLVMGSDWRPSSGFRTDVIMLVSINTRKGTVSVVSFPRDLYVTIPGWTTQRINTAFPHGGFDMMADTFEYNFGVRPKYYIMTNFNGFVGIVNSLGGINVNVGSALTDTCDLPQAKNGYCSVSPGTNHMDGGMALWYVRSRHTSSDLDRMRRTQEVLYAIFGKLMSLDAASRLPELYQQYQSSVETNMGINDIVPLLPVASQALADSSRVSRYSVAQGEVTPYVTETGAQVLLPNYDAITQLILKAVFNK